ncbi:SDR family oxidoreductase [Haloechinothrix sp. LS1_15]|uniref:SDR family oxidoreductase n=1 Tax=Haloechinothrix sp. LS1_15 TaxID=2652248 RepID=UPI002947CDAD|nr:SDR family oxidoreductase [Haloechinothrix sp. LS1_15]MDV6011033.1 SDR family oxidoreductase [Haloechinothrix sp. LS1_15]
MTSTPLALVTGASSGIGTAIAHALGPTHRLLLGGRDKTALDAVAAAVPDAAPWQVDLTDPTKVAEAVENITELDVLVHSAGIAALGSIEQAGVEDWRASFEINVTAVAELTRQLLPALRAAHGHVVVINSGAGYNARPGWGPYAASKFALRAFADALRAEEEPAGLRVTSVYPGRTATPMQQAIVADEGRDYDPDRFLRPESVAHAVAQAVTATPDAHPTEITLRPMA